MELDSHADTCAFGSHCLVVNDTGTQVSVDGFTSAVGSVSKVKVVIGVSCNHQKVPLSFFSKIAKK